MARLALTKWADIRDEHIERIGQEDFEAGKEQMLAEARGWRLAEIRRRRRLNGSLRSLPYPRRCRVLEEKLPGWTAEQLF
jgi:hypothetical protein